MATAEIVIPEGMSAYDYHVWQFFHEWPAQGPIIFAMVVYFVIAFVNLGITVRTRTYFMLYVVASSLFEAAGYAWRLATVKQPRFGYWVAMETILIVTPVLLALADYTCVSRLITMDAEKRAKERAEATAAAGKGIDAKSAAAPGAVPVPGAGSDPNIPWLHAKSKWIAPGFLASDLVCLGLQGFGCGMLADETNTAGQETGRKLVLAGLAFQISFFTLFTFLTLHVHLSPSFSLRQDASLRPVFRVLYATIVLLYVRNIFRIIEFAQGFYGYLATHEVFLYTFDFLEIFLCMVLFTAFHFGFYMGPTARARAEGGNVGDVECAIRTPVQPITNA